MNIGLRTLSSPMNRPSRTSMEANLPYYHSGDESVDSFFDHVQKRKLEHIDTSKTAKHF